MTTDGLRNDGAAYDGVWNEVVAAGYDADAPDMFDPGLLGPTVDLLAGYADGGRACEFAIGTGRVALPLSTRGIAVAGIDNSPAMLDVLRAKPGADRLEIVQGDMATGTVPGEFDLVYLVFNTITNILTQAGQVACFRNAARHLRPGGRFLVETFLPDLRRFPPGAPAQVFHLAAEKVGLDTFDPLTQRLTSHHFTVANGQGGVFRSEHRWAWPSELDLMAELAGLTLENRWSNWSRDPFTADSTSHISVWVKPH